MEDEKMHYRHMLLFYFCKGKNVIEAHKKLFSAYGDKVLSKRLGQNLFKKFIGGDFVVTDKLRPGSPVEVYNKENKKIIDIAEKLSVIYVHWKTFVINGLYKENEFMGIL